MTRSPRPQRRAVPRRRWRLVAGVLALTAVVAAACGSDSPEGASGGTGSDGGPVKVKVGILPIADVAPIWYGQQKGYFAEEGIEVETVPAQGGAAIVPSVVSGEYQFGFSNIVSLMLAREKGANVKIVSNLVNGASSTSDNPPNALMVAPDSGINSVQDLAGRTFAVSTQKNAGEVTVKATLRNAGVDISGVSFAEYGFPTMNAVLQRGEVDAVWQAEPFVTLGKDAGLKVIVDPMHGTMPDLTIASIFASEEYLAENAEVAQRFQRALAKSIEEARNDEAGTRETIGANTQTPPAVLPRIALANWRADVNMASIDLQGRLAAEFEILEESPEAGDLVWSP